MGRLRHRFELRLAVLAAAALLIAQLGAVAHAYSHDASFGVSAAHQNGAGSHNPCNDCLAFAPLLSAAGAAGTLPFLEPQGPGSAAVAAAKSLANLPLTLAFRARAPPPTPAR